MQIRVSGGNCLCCPKNSKRDLGAVVVVVRDRNGGLASKKKMTGV